MVLGCTAATCSGSTGAAALAVTHRLLLLGVKGKVGVSLGGVCAAAASAASATTGRRLSGVILERCQWCGRGAVVPHLEGR